MIIDTTGTECIKDGLNALADYFEAALQGEENKSALMRMWKQQMGVLNAILDHTRSRPAPSPQWTDDEVMKELQAAFDRGVEAAESTIDMQKHDAAKARDTAIRNAIFADIEKLKVSTQSGATKPKSHDLTQLQTKSNQNDPIRVPQYERD